MATVAPLSLTLRFHGLSLPEEEASFEPGTSYEELLRARDIHPETVLVFEDGDVVPAEAEAKPGATVKVLRILSGG